MTRFKLTLEYDGAGFVGWQRQTNGLSVQEAVEAAIGAFCGEAATAFAAGRTDAGVHALGQVIHVDVARPAAPGVVADAVNAHLRPHRVAVIAAEAVDEGFHARFSARGRAYLYRIVNRRAPLAVDRGRAWRVGGPLDADAMQAAAQRLVGRHDFTTFRAASCQAASPVKTLDRLQVERAGREIRISARARSFLHRQMRNMVGSLKLVGEGKWDADDLARALAARDRARGGPTAPAAGLYLAEIVYDRDDGRDPSRRP